MLGVGLRGKEHQNDQCLMEVIGLAIYHQSFRFGDSELQKQWQSSFHDMRQPEGGHEVMRSIGAVFSMVMLIHCVGGYAHKQIIPEHVMR